MRFDDYNTFWHNHPYMSVLTVNIAPVFSHLLGKVVSLMDNLFGTSQKTDSTAQITLNDSANTGASSSLSQRTIQSPPTNATQNIPASTLSNIPNRPVVSNDGDNINASLSQTPGFSDDKYNLYHSFATALDKPDFIAVKQTLVEKGNELLESIRDDLYEYDPKKPMPARDRLRNDFLLVSTNSFNKKMDRDQLRATISDPLNSQLTMEDDEKRASELDDDIRNLEREGDKLNNLLTPYELLDAIFKWYENCTNEEFKILEQRLDDKWAAASRRGSFNPRFNKTYDLRLCMFSEGILPDTVVGSAIKALALTHDVTIMFQNSNMQTVYPFGKGHKKVYLYRNEKQYSTTSL